MDYIGLIELAREYSWNVFDANPTMKPFHIFHTGLFIAHADQLLLRQGHELNAEVVRLSAIMHDIGRPTEDLGLIKKIGRLCVHHIEGARMAKEFLDSQGFPYSQSVASAILGHGGKTDRITPEERAIYDCQRVSDSNPALYCWFKANNSPLEEISTFFKGEFEACKKVPPHYDFSKAVIAEHLRIMEPIIIG